MRRSLKKLFGQNVATESVSEVDSDDDISWLFPPATMVESAPWDQFWRDQLSHGVAGFVHLFCDDGELVDVMRANGFKTVLCIGNGISQEPRALSWAGFDVTALDLSPFATEVGQWSRTTRRVPCRACWREIWWSERAIGVCRGRRL